MKVLQLLRHSASQCIWYTILVSSIPQFVQIIYTTSNHNHACTCLTCRDISLIPRLVVVQYVLS